MIIHLQKLRKVILFIIKIKSNKMIYKINTKFSIRAIEISVLIIIFFYFVNFIFLYKK